MRVRDGGRPVRRHHRGAEVLRGAGGADDQQLGFRFGLPAPPEHRASRRQTRKSTSKLTSHLIN